MGRTQLGIYSLNEFSSIQYSIGDPGARLYSGSREQEHTLLNSDLMLNPGWVCALSNQLFYFFNHHV